MTTINRHFLMTHPTPLPKFRLIIIGDEILSGRRQDKHFSRCVEILTERGLQLHAAEIITDERAHIVQTLKRSFATDDIVFCCRSEEHTSELQSRGHLVCRLLLEKKKQT